MDLSQNNICSRTLLLAAVLLTMASAPVIAAEPVITNSLGMTFVRIASGGFMMGSPLTEKNRGTSETLHRITISKTFYMQTTEVTLGQWRGIMGRSFFGGRRGPSDMPVVKVSWFDAQKFIDKLNRRGEGVYRLPTEAEWEYAARAGTGSAYPWGDAIDCSRAMYSNNPLKSEDCVAAVTSKGLKPGQPAPVGKYSPNAWGLYDMAGNVWEWVADWYGPYDLDQTVNPVGPHTGEMRVKRGGSWYKHGHSCRSANRASSNPASRERTLGFRLVRTIPAK